MWFMNKIANPLVSLILRSPLHGMLSASLLLLTYHGRKSGKEYSLPVQYAQFDHTLVIVPGNPHQKTWWRNLSGGYPVEITLRGQSLSAKAYLQQGEAEADTVTELLQHYLQRFPAAARLHNVRQDQAGSFDVEDLRRAALNTILVRVDLAG